MTSTADARLERFVDAFRLNDHAPESGRPLHGWKGEPGVSARAAGAGLVLALAVVAGCGSGSDGSRKEAQEVLQQLKSLQEGEIVIQGFSAPRIVGPYRFKPGGYVFSYRHKGDERLNVTLESKPRSRAQPYQLLVDSDQASGTKAVALTGKLYVHIVDAGGEYMLRFRPKRR